MKPRARARRESICHADDWLMTYADMITLLLCFFAIFLSISITRKDAPKPVPSVVAVALPVQPRDFLEGDLPFHGLEHATHPTHDAAAVAPRKVDEPLALTTPQLADASAVPVKATTAPSQPTKATTVPSQPAASGSPAASPQTGDKQATPGPKENGPKGDRITILEMSSAAFFASGDATLSAAGEAILRDASIKLKSDEFKDYEITVEGHTDDTPIHTAQFPSNWELSTARAASVVHFLLDQGIAAQKLRAIGYADARPKVPDRDADGNPIPENQAQNRRVVIKLEKIEPATKVGQVTPVAPPEARIVD
jgi:flagellar motor protein MotB